MNSENKAGLQINYWFLMATAGLMLIAGAVALVFFLRTNFLANKKIAEAAEASRPANLDLIVITDKSCSDCFNVYPLLDQIGSQNVRVGVKREVDRENDEGKELIKKFTITRLPTFLVSGELNKEQKLADFFAQAGETIDGTFVFRQGRPPYMEVASGNIKGRINFDLIVDSSCTSCYDVTRHEDILQQFGITTRGTVIDAKSIAGKKLINKYGIKLLPTFVLSGEVGEYPALKPVWEQVGDIASDGTYIFTKGVPLMGTYKNLSTNKIITPPAPTSTQQ